VDVSSGALGAGGFVGGVQVLVGVLRVCWL